MPRRKKPLHDVFENGDESIRKGDASINDKFGIIAPFECPLAHIHPGV